MHRRPIAPSLPGFCTLTSAMKRPCSHRCLEDPSRLLDQPLHVDIRDEAFVHRPLSRRLIAPSRPVLCALTSAMKRSRRARCPEDPSHLRDRLPSVDIRDRAFVRKPLPRGLIASLLGCLSALASAIKHQRCGEFQRRSAQGVAQHFSLLHFLPISTRFHNVSAARFEHSHAKQLQHNEMHSHEAVQTFS